MLAFLGDEDHTRHTSFLGYEGVVRTESRSDMYDTRTILGGHIVARDNLEGTLAWVSPWDELLIFDAYEVRTFALPEDFWGFAELFAISSKTSLCE